MRLRAAAGIFLILILLMGLHTIIPLPMSPGRVSPAGAQGTPAEGFGAETPGGSGGATVHVTTLSDSGPGSLRAAVAQGNRTVVFDVAGTIQLASPLYVNGAFITIDGFSAPSPGITLRGDALVIRGNHGAHDVIVRGIRVRDAVLDGIQIAYGAYNVLIDHVSVTGSGDGNLDITEDAHDVTVTWSILGAPASDKNMLVKYGAARLSLHHNLLAFSEQRNPVVSTDDAGTPATDITADIRNNVIWDWGLGVGIMIHKGALANVVANFTASPTSGLTDQAQGVVVCALNCAGDLESLAFAHVNGNLNGNPLLALDMNAEGNVLEAVPAAPVTTQNAYAAAQAVLAGAGPRPLDAADAQILAAIALAPRPPGPNLSVSFLDVEVGNGSLTITDRTTNGGTLSAGPSTTRFYLSANQILDAGDVLIGARGMGALGADASTSGSTTFPIPAGIAAGTHHVIARADGAAAVAETNEADNATVRTALLTLPDVIVSSLSVPAQATPGATIAVTETTRNQSSVPAAATTTRYFLSLDAVLDAADGYLGERSVGALAGGGSSAKTTQVAIPAGSPGGNAYILAQADAGAALVELSVANNVTARVIQIGSPDLVVSALTAPAAGKAGSAVTVSEATRNVGTMSAPATSTRYHLSTDGAWSPGDVLLGARAVPALAAGAQSGGGSKSVTIPAGTPSGTYFILARADASEAAVESDEANNTRGVLIEIGFDLAIPAISAPTSAAAGVPFAIGDTTTNQGPGPAPASTTAFFLSPTSTMSAEAVMLGSRSVPALSQGASSVATTSVTIPPGMGGSFYVIALANAGASGAAWVGGNNGKSKAISVGADLSVTSLMAPGSTAVGNTIAITDTTRNTGAVAAPASTTRYFLSTSSGTLSPGAIPIGARAVPAMSGGVSSSGSVSVTIPAGTPPGSYFLVAKGDGDDAIAEFSEANNTKSRAITVAP